ncbi:MAG: hypothetical protein K0S71_2177 [Clostridia bacterium]|nr:hypothetical protein [Clostridia bacterium]
MYHVSVEIKRIYLNKGEVKLMKKYYCPTCKKEVEVLEACGSSSYFCNNCKKLISSKAILEEQDLEEEKVQNEE